MTADLLVIGCWAACTPFIFSSSRRHTRWPRDWSSDVCSSDLATNSPERSGLLFENRLAARLTDLVDESHHFRRRGLGHEADDVDDQEAERHPQQSAVDVEIGRATCRESG